MYSRPVEFKTFDQTTLRGDLYLPAKAKQVPLVILTSGLTLLKEHYLPNFAKAFQDHDIAALVYDHRNYGSSDGTPRSETDVFQQANDASDAVTFAASLDAVDPNRIAIWGIGHSGGMSIIAAALDPRIAAALILMPFTSGSSDSAAVFPLSRVWQNRVAQKTAYVKIWPDSREEALADPPTLLLPGEQAWNFIEGARDMTRRARGEEFLNQLSLQSFYHIAKCEPREFVHLLKGKPLLYLVAETDALTGPVDMHREVFERGGEWVGKEWVVMKDHHLLTYVGDTLVDNVRAQIEFVKKYL
ncbi:alpha/beta-hydrolase [Polyplosphaeria fusca]|uniref:Alpha/beta-hydrolase n=1 Tax=Polyplosphaeria fusca TaxID=682080 RepID=A0A9P4UXY5_9PLEO|nr:alpha/beta-hydrolase [Polyplosphaeria fusca]